MTDETFASQQGLWRRRFVPDVLDNRQE